MSWQFIALAYVTFGLVILAWIGGFTEDALWKNVLRLIVAVLLGPVIFLAGFVWVALGGRPPGSK